MIEYFKPQLNNIKNEDKNTSKIHGINEFFNIKRFYCIAFFPLSKI